jgi:hypothetical protein
MKPNVIQRNYDSNTTYNVWWVVFSAYVALLHKI